MAKRIQLRRDTAANWDRLNPILAQGEVAIDLTNKNLKIGNGLDRWDSLTYAVERGKITSIDENTYVEIGQEGTQESGFIFLVNEGIETITLNPSLLNVNINALFNAGVPSNDPFTGSLIVQGGVGISGDLNVGGEIRANTVYIEDNITADVIGNVTGNVFGDLIGDVYSTNGVKILENGTSGTNANFIGNVTGNITSAGISSFTNIDVNGGAIDGTIIGATQPSAITGTTITGTTITANTFSGNLNGSLKGDIFAENGLNKILDNGTNGTDAVFTGIVQGSVNGALIGDVFASNGTSKILDNGTNGSDAILTGNVLGNITSAGTSTFSNIDINGGTIDGAVIGANSPNDITGSIITATIRFQGDFQGSFVGNLTGDILNDNGSVALSHGTTANNNEARFIGDIYASDGTTIVLDNGTSSLPAQYTGNVTGDIDADHIETNTLTTNDNVDINGDLYVNGSGEFTGNITAPNLSYDGTNFVLANPSKFIVETATGNTIIEGTLSVTGTSTFTGDMTAGNIDASTLDTTGDVNIGGDLTVIGTSTFANITATDLDIQNLQVDINANISGNLDVGVNISVTGLSTFTGNMTAGNIDSITLDVSNDVTIGEDLTVTGLTTLNGILDVNNTSNFGGNVSLSSASDLIIQNAASIPTTVFSVDGGTGNTYIGGTLNVDGTSTFTGDMTAGNIDASTLDTTGDVSVGGDLSVTGTSTFTGDMTAGNIDASALDTTGDVSVGGDLSVTGTSTFTGDMTAGNIDASTLDTTGDVSVGGNTNLVGTLSVTGTSTFTGDMTAGNIDASTLDTTGDVSVGGNTNLVGTLSVTGVSSMSSHLSVGGDLSVIGTSTFTGDMTAVNIDASTLDTTGDVSVGGNLGVTGTFALTGDFSANNITATGNVLVQGTLEVLGETTFKNNFEVIRATPSDPETITTLERVDATELNVSGNTDLVGSLALNGNFSVEDTNIIPNVFFNIDSATGNTQTQGTLTVANGTTLNGSLDVNSTSDFSGNINLSNAADFTVQNAAATPITVFSVDGTTGNVFVNGTFEAVGPSTFTGDLTAVNIDANTLDTTGNVSVTGNLAVNGTSTLALVDIDAGNIDNTTIGATQPAAVTATDIEAANITITNEGILKLKGSVNPTYIGFKAPANFIASTTYELPGVKGLDGYVLSLNTAGDKLEWASPDLFGGGQVAVSADYGNDLNDGINKPVRSIKRALQIASGIVYDINGVVNEKRIVVSVASGDYIEDNPIIIPDNVSVVGAGLRACNIRPLNANKDMLRVRNGCYFTEITFRDFLNVDKNPSHTFDYAVSFDDPSDIECSRIGYVNLPNKKPVITISPYIQNCSIISFLGGNGVLIDGKLVSVPNKPKNAIEVENPPVGGIPVQGKSMVANAFTMLSFGGVGWHVINDAYAQIVSCFQIFCLTGSYCQSGGYLSITNSATNFGKFALRASGYSPNAFEFDRGIVVEVGTATLQQTITAIGFGNIPVQDYVIRFRSPIFKMAYDILISKKDDLRAYIITWINNEIANASIGSIWYQFTYDTLICGRDVEYIVDAIAYDILSGGDSKSIEIAYIYVESNDIGFVSELVQATAAITELKSELANYLIDVGLNTTSNSLFDKILNIIANPTTVSSPIESSNVGDITSSFVNNLLSDKLSFNTTVSVDIASNTFTVIADPQPFVEGQAVVYSSEGNQPIVGLNNEQTYFVNVLNYNPSTDIFTFRLFNDDSMTSLVDLKSTGIGTHAFIKNVREFYIDDLISNHNEYQIITLPLGTYEFVTGRLVTGDDGDIFAYVYGYDSDTRKLTVSIEQQEINGLIVRNFFNGSSKIDYDHSASPVQDIQLQGNAYIDFRNDLYTTKFRISSTVLGDALTNTANIPENQIWLHRPSIVNSSGHTWEYAGSGTDYNALPQNGGKTIVEYEQVSDLPGRVYSSGTNELGDFKVGNFIKAENKTGNVTFTNTVSIAELDTLKLRIGDIVIQEISSDPGLGDNEIGGAKNTRLSTQRAMRRFLQERLGKFIDKDLATNTKPSAVVQLNASGKINADLIPAVRNFVIYRESGYRSRLLLVEEVPPVNILNGDLVTETFSTIELTLDIGITAKDGDIVVQENSLASGIIYGNVTGTTNIVIASNKATFNTAFNTIDQLIINGVPSGSVPDIIGPITTDQAGNYILAEAIRTQFLLLDPNVSYDFTGITNVTGAINKTEATVNNTRFGVIGNYTSLTPGDGYSPDPGDTIYEFVPLTNITGTGTGAYADITVTNGSVSAVNLRRGGTGYAVNDILSANATDIGGTVNTAFTITVSIIQQRLYITYSSSVKFEASIDFPEYIEDASALTQNTVAENTVTKTFSAQTDINYTNSQITIVSHGYTDGDPIRYSVGTLVIGGLVNGNVYYARVIDADIIEVYSNYTLTNKINFTSNGLGTHSFTVRNIDIESNTVFIPNHGFNTGTALRVSGANLPTALVDNNIVAVSNNDILFVGSVTTNSFTLHQLRSTALGSVSGITLGVVDLVSVGAGTITFTEQNVVVQGTVDTSSATVDINNVPINWSSLTSTNIDAANIVTGIINPSRLAQSGSANSDTFLRGDNTWTEVVQTLKPANASSAISITGSFKNVAGVTEFYGPLNLDVYKVDSSPIFSDPLDTYSNLGVAKFRRDQFTIGTGPSSGQVFITPAISGGTIDAKTVEGNDINYILSSSNHSTQPVIKGGTGIETFTIGDMLYANGTTSLAKLAVGTANYIMTSTGSAPQWSQNITVNDLNVLGNISQSGSVSTLTAYDIRMSDNNIELGSVIAQTNKIGTINDVTASSSTVTMTFPSSTDGMIPGMILTKVTGLGNFGANAIVTQINSSTQFTFKADTSNTLGTITFDVSGASDSTADNGGITIKGSSGNNKTLQWIKAIPAWTANDNFNIPTGKEYKVNGTTVLSSTQVLGKELTSPVGNIVTSGSYWTRTFALMGA